MRMKAGRGATTEEAEILWGEVVLHDDWVSMAAEEERCGPLETEPDITVRKV